MVSMIGRAAYAARQGARVAWYMGHYYAAQSRRERLVNPDGTPFRPSGPVVARERLLGHMAELFRRDLRNAEEGLYPLPDDDDGSLPSVLRRSRNFFADLPAVSERRRERRARDGMPTERKSDLPSYFLQNFHFQTGGYLTEESADLYDMQVEVLFSGTANAMRRQALVPVAKFLEGRDQRKVHLLDLACGTGRFLRFVKRAWPRLPVTGVDLSESYLEEARDHLAGYSACDLCFGKAEGIPLEDASRDIVTCIYLFHELPPRVRRAAAKEIARVLRPGGLFVFVDSLQSGDRDGYDGLLEAFQAGFHEPYFGSYVDEDFVTLFGKAGLVHEETTPAFLSKVMVFRREEKAAKGTTAKASPRRRKRPPAKPADAGDAA